MQVVAGRGVLEAEFGGVEGQPRGAAFVLEHLAVGPLRVHLVAADRVAGFREVNADLVRAARFQPAREQRVTRQPLLDRDVRDRFLPNVGQSRAAAATDAFAF